MLMFKEFTKILKDRWKTSVSFRGTVVCLGFWLAYTILFFPAFAILELFKPIFLIYFICGSVLVALNPISEVMFWLGMVFAFAEIIDYIKEMFKGE